MGGPYDYLPKLLKEVDIETLPVALGGKDESADYRNEQARGVAEPRISPGTAVSVCGATVRPPPRACLRPAPPSAGRPRPLSLRFPPRPCRARLRELHATPAARRAPGQPTCPSRWGLRRSQALYRSRRGCRPPCRRASKSMTSEADVEDHAPRGLTEIARQTTERGVGTILPSCAPYFRRGDAV